MINEEIVLKALVVALKLNITLIYPHFRIPLLCCISGINFNDKALFLVNQFHLRNLQVISIK